MDVFWVTTERVLSAIPLFAIIFVLTFAAKWIFQRTSRFCIDEELTERDNPAFGIAFGGYMVGIAIALSGTVLPWESVPTGGDLLIVAMFGVVAALLMRASLWVNHRAILYQFPLYKELIVDHNLGTGFVVAGSSIATGFMLRGVMAGYSHSVLLGLRDTVIYFAVGQVALVIGAWIYAKTAGYDIHGEIERRNVGAGVSFGGYLAALGYIVSTALTGATSHWMDEIVTTAVIAFVGMVLLVIAHMVADYVLLPKAALWKEIVEDRNVAAGVIAAASFMIVAILFAGAVDPNRLALSAVGNETGLMSGEAVLPEPDGTEASSEAPPAKNDDASKKREAGR